MMQALAGHLWQSTFFALAAGLMTVAFRSHRAQVRYWLWLSASLKFLMPFALLLNLGRYLATWMPTTRQIAAPLASYAIEQFSGPSISRSLPPTTTAADTIHWLPLAILAIWLAGFLTAASIRLRGWLRIRTAMRASTAMGRAGTPEIRVSPVPLEPGVVGIVRPVLLLPEGITECLTPSELESVLAHELCHVRRRDNLFATLHMIVEAMFWFHPLVWWIGAHLVEERERACDEEVLSQGSHPEVYADAILHVCKHYAQSPLACVSGVSGASIKRRIEAIMSNRVAIRLNVMQKTALTVAAMVTLGIPVFVGILIAPKIQAQAALAPRPKFEVASIRSCNPEDRPAGGGNGNGRAGGGSAAPPNPELFRAVCAPVVRLISTAYVQFADGHNAPDASQWAPRDFQGGPDWIRQDGYTIEAKPAGPQTRAMMNGPMLQALLEDRFKLKIHHESKEVPVYALVVGKGGPRLQPTPQGGCTPRDPDGLPSPVVPGQPLPCGYMGGSETGGVDAVGVPITSLFPILGGELRRSIIDQTGLTGLFNYHFDVALGPPNSSPQLDDPAYEDTIVNITSALEKLGLKIQPAKGAEDIIVIDSIERPSAN